MDSTQQTGTQVALYTLANGGELPIEFDINEETAWLTQEEMSRLFDVDRSVVRKHLKNIYTEGELDEKSTSAIRAEVRQEGNRTVNRKITRYNLDAIISVGYRVKSSTATNFRIWATSHLKSILTQGYSIESKLMNAEQIEKLKQVANIMSRSDDIAVASIGNYLNATFFENYAPALDILEAYDHARITSSPDTTPTWELTTEHAMRILDELDTHYPGETFSGKPRENGAIVEGIIGAIYQSAFGTDAYPSAEAKAANLLYFVVKDHPLHDGNKRAAAVLFLTFCQHNGLLHDNHLTPGEVAALTLLASLSDPSEKELITELVVRYIQGL